jgi:hypothetical protein
MEALDTAVAMFLAMIRNLAAIVSAACDGKLEAVKSLVSATTNGEGADHDTRKRCVQEPAIIVAAGDGHIKIVKYLLMEGADPTLQCCPQRMMFILMQWARPQKVMLAILEPCVEY